MAGGVPFPVMWRGWRNAEIYDVFVREHQVYRRLNQRMVDLADLAEARRVLDLGCGTGATTLACLRVLDPEAEVVGIDASEEMIEVARANVLDPRARFLVSTAAAVDRAAPGPFDRVVCNAAFWQFPAPGPVLHAAAAVTSPGGLFVFNAPAERVAGERAPVHPFQVALARAIEARRDRPFPDACSGLDPSEMARRAREEGFLLERVDRLPYRGLQGELMQLMAIPAMIRPLTPGIDDATREAILDEARERSDPDLPVEVPWIYFVLRRREGES